MFTLSYVTALHTFMIKINAIEEYQVSIYAASYLKILQIWWTNMNFDIAELYNRESISWHPISVSICNEKR